MKKLPKFVVSRLVLRQQHGADHPNPDMLAAFGEGRLFSRERTDVLEHLGTCPECRELVALMSAREESGVSSSSKVRRGVWWRWAATVAVACLVAAVVWGPKSVWKSPGPPPVPVIANGAAVQNLPSVEPEPQETKVERQAKQGKAPQLPMARQRATVRERSVPVPKQKAEVLSAQNQRTESEITVTAAAPNASSASLKELKHAQGFVNGMAPQFRSRVAMDERKESIWSLPALAGANGIVQRSEDGGRTWESVQVDGRSRFYALSATGMEIWVGGAEGALFHSVDNGAHWMPVAVADGEERLTDTITRIDVRDNRVVRLKVQGGSSWITVDGGLHWRLE